MTRALLMAARGGGGFTPPPPTNWTITGAAAIDTALAVVYTANAFTVTVASVVEEEGFRPANGATYNELWTRDHAYTLWHNPTTRTAAQRRKFVEYRLATRSVTPPNFVADRISATGTVTYKNGGQLPFMDGIAFVILALWADWTETGSTTTFTANKSVIDACMAATPRSVNGCVWSDPADPSCYYGFTDAVNITGDMAMGTAMHAWAYKMLDEISGGGSSSAEGDTYANLRAHAEAGLATRRRSNGFYEASSGNAVNRDDVWCTALAVAEGLVSGAGRSASAQALADAYSANQITQNGLVRHLPVGQYWPDIAPTADTYQNGGYWLTPLWDCVRAVALVNSSLALAWAAQAMSEVNAEITASGASLAPYEWRNGATISGPKGYTASAAVVHRFI